MKTRKRLHASLSECLVTYGPVNNGCGQNGRNHGCFTREALEALEERAESEGKAVEELIIEAVFKQLNIADPEARAELHLKLCEKYMREAEDFLAKKDYVQASRKAWGAASQIVKASAAKEGRS